MRRLVDLFRKRTSSMAPQEPECRRLFAPDASRDIFLVTYPRSGTTWVSCIATELMFGISPDTLTALDYHVPDIHVMPEQSQVPPSQYYLIKSHLPLVGPPPYGEYRRVIYLIRDPRDVLLSYFRFAQKQYLYSGNLLSFTKDWVSGRIFPCSWQEHVNSWLGPREDKPSFELSVFRYEDLIHNSSVELARFAELIGVRPSRERLEEIITDTTPEKMRVRESNGNLGAAPGLQFIGPAKDGVWREAAAITPEIISIMREYVGPTMRRVGYQI